MAKVDTGLVIGTDMYTTFIIIIALLLVAMNAFFVAAEFAMVKLRHTRVGFLKKKYKLRGKILAYVHQHLDAYLSACQLGVTLASLGLGWIGEPAFSKLFAPIILLLPLYSAKAIAVVSFIILFSFLSFLHIVLGELIPKSLSIRRSEQISLWTAVPLYCFYWTMYPAIWVLNSCATFVLKVTGLNKMHRGEHFYSTDEIKLILSTSHLHGELTKDEANILEQTLDFADLNVTEVMRLPDGMVALSLLQPIDEIMTIVMKYRYSRYPVYDKKHKKIIGLLHVKDLFTEMYQDKQIKSIHHLLRPVLKISQRVPALEVLRQFREGMPHFALVYKKDQLLGFVTLDNLLHVLIGRIEDEFHKTKDDWQTHPDGSITLTGEASIFSLERALDRDISVSDESLETVSGLILHQVGNMPAEKQEVEFEEFIAVIEKIRGHKMQRIRIIPKARGVE